MVAAGRITSCPIMKNHIRQIIEEHVSVSQVLLADTGLQDQMIWAVKLLVRTFRNGGKVLFCGNGGSAADAQHLAAELSGRFLMERSPLFAEALHVNSSFLTAVANDYGYPEVFARALAAMGRGGDVLVALSTSGNSPNVLRAIKTAHDLGMQVVGLTGAGGGQMSTHCHLLLKFPSVKTPRIQEGHLLIGHILCEMVEAELFS